MSTSRLVADLALSRLRIGDVATRSGVSVDTLRFYEKRGLLQPMGRRPSGYREYSPETIPLVRFIRRAQALGFTLIEVAELVRLRQRAWAGDAPHQVREAAGAKIRDIDHRMRQLGALRDALGRLITACDEACPLEAEARRAGECGEPGAAKDARRDSVAGVPLDCPLIEALDADGVELPQADASVRSKKLTKQLTEPPAPGRRPAKRTRSPARVSSPTTQRGR
jgi:DNA-binding transcriptional MerR regulator